MSVRPSFDRYSGNLWPSTEVVVGTYVMHAGYPTEARMHRAVMTFNDD
jgi:hypothetical protein